MKIENLGVVYGLSVEDVNKAIQMYLESMGQKDIIVTKVQPEFIKEYYQVSNFEQDYNEIFDGLKVVVKIQGIKDNE
jgi:ABC-type lipoprotein release transport system permease subunit